MCTKTKDWLQVSLIIILLIIFHISVYNIMEIDVHYIGFSNPQDHFPLKCNLFAHSNDNRSCKTMTHTLHNHNKELYVIIRSTHRISGAHSDPRIEGRIQISRTIIIILYNKCMQRVMWLPKIKVYAIKVTIKWSHHVHVSS